MRGKLATRSPTLGCEGWGGGVQDQWCSASGAQCPTCWVGTPLLGPSGPGPIPPSLPVTLLTCCGDPSASTSGLAMASGSLLDMLQKEGCKEKAGSREGQACLAPPCEMWSCYAPPTHQRLRPPPSSCPIRAHPNFQAPPHGGRVMSRPPWPRPKGTRHHLKHRPQTLPYQSSPKPSGPRP